MKQLTLFISLLFCFSCKNEKPVPNFDLTAERTVELNVNENIKNALNKLSYSSINLHYLCDNGTDSNQGCSGFLEAKVNFYFTITADKQELIVIQNFNNECMGNDCFSLVRQTEKFIIPLKEIKRIDISDAYTGIFGITTIKKIALVVIDTEYDANTVSTQTVTAQKWKKDSDEITYEDRDGKTNSILFYSDINQANIIKEAIENLAEEY